MDGNRNANLRSLAQFESTMSLNDKKLKVSQIITFSNQFNMLCYICRFISHIGDIDSYMNLEVREYFFYRLQFFWQIHLSYTAHGKIMHVIAFKYLKQHGHTKVPATLLTGYVPKIG